MSETTIKFSRKHSRNSLHDDTIDIDNARIVESFLCLSEMMRIDMIQYLSSTRHYKESNFVRNIKQSAWLGVLIQFCDCVDNTLGQCIRDRIENIKVEDAVIIKKNVGENEFIIAPRTIMEPQETNTIESLAQLLKGKGNVDIIDITANGPYEFLYDVDTLKNWTHSVNGVLRNSEMIAKINPSKPNYNLPFSVYDSEIGCDCCGILCIRHGPLSDALFQRYIPFNEHGVDNSKYSSVLSDEYCHILKNYTITLVSMIVSIPRSTLYRYLFNPHVVDHEVVEKFPFGNNIMTRLGSSLHYFNNCIIKSSNTLDTGYCMRIIKELIDYTREGVDISKMEIDEPYNNNNIRYKYTSHSAPPSTSKSSSSPSSSSHIREGVLSW